MFFEMLLLLGIRFYDPRLSVFVASSRFLNLVDITPSQSL
jgi:hypothetical protein